MVISWYSPSGVQRRTHISCGCSPPARWGLLDFIRAVLLLRLLTRRLLPAVQIPVGAAGLPPRAPDPSGHCRTSTASTTSRSQWALPDLNRDFQIAVGTAGPQPRLPDRSGHCRTPTATSRSQWALPDLNRDFQIAVSRMKCSFWCPHVSRLESLVFLWPRRVYGGSCKSFPFRRFSTVNFGGSLARNARFSAPTCLVSSLWFSCGFAVSMREAAKPLLFEGFQAGLRGKRGTLWHSNLFDNVSKVSNLEEASHEMLVLLRPRVSSRVSGFPVASPCLWGKLQNLSFSKVFKQVVMSFCVADVALCEIPTCFIPCRKFFVWQAQQCTPHFTLYTLHSTLYTPHSTLHTLHFPLRTPQSTLYTPHSTLYTSHSTLHTLHFTLHTPQFTLHTLHFTLHTPHFTLHTLHSTLHTLHFTLHTLHFTVHTPQFTLHTLHFTLHTPHFTLHTLHSTLYTLHFTLHTLHSTLHTLHCTLLTPHFTLLTPHSTLYTPHSTLFTPHCRMVTGEICTRLFKKTFAEKCSGWLHIRVFRHLYHEHRCEHSGSWAASCFFWWHPHCWRNPMQPPCFPVVFSLGTSSTGRGLRPGHCTRGMHGSISPGTAMGWKTSWSFEKDLVATKIADMWIFHGILLMIID